jgi:two-component system CheB/CheR fusion protein
MSSLISFPVVGVGASAGGLEALMEFIISIGAHRGLACIIVQHLDPHHPSDLANLLAAKTILPVKEGIDGLEVAPGCIYVIPSNKVMTLAQGRLQVTPRQQDEASPTPINQLFYSLAIEEEANAIGVVLSGTGSDGALGLKAIKAGGGLTFAQDERSAKFFGMPKAAIDLHVVDRILAPRDIAKAILRLVSLPKTDPVDGKDLMPSESDQREEEVIHRLLIKVKQSTGVDLTRYRRGTIKRRLLRRLALHGADTLEDYLAYVEATPDEAQVLLQDFLIPVTSFFRDPDVFESLAKTVLPHLFDGLQGHQRVRVWVPGCSSGEEVYSIAILIAEYLDQRGKPLNLQIFGTDLSESAIEAARAGIYEEAISRHVSDARLGRFFVKVGEHYRITQSIRDCCVFARQNAVYDPPFSKIDLISCRNLLIYLDDSLQKKVLPLFHYALNPGGFLLLGMSETLGASSPIFRVVDKTFRIFRKMALIEGESFTRLEASGLRQQSTTMTVKGNIEKDGMARWYSEADRLSMKRFVPPAILCDGDLNVLEYRGDTALFMTTPVGPPTNQLLKLLRPELLVPLSNALSKSRTECTTARCESLYLPHGEADLVVNLEVVPFRLKGEEPWCFIVFFEKQRPSPEQLKGKSSGFWTSLIVTLKDRWLSRTPLKSQRDEAFSRLTQELESTQTYIKAILESHEIAMEALKTAEEKLSISNEEYQCSNEELETAKEELLSSNEQLRSRNRDLTGLNESFLVARDFLESIVETVNQPLLVLDTKAIITLANGPFYRHFKMTPEGILGVSFFELGECQWSTPELHQLINQVMNQSSPLEPIEVKIHCQNIGERNLKFHAQRLLSSSQKQIVIAIQDDTDYQAALDALSLTDQRKDDFLSMLAHELRNPLAPIQHALDLWKRGDANLEAIQKAQETMSRQLRQETRLIDDLLDLSRINLGKILLRTEPVDLALLVQHTIDDLQPQIVSHSHQLIANIPTTPMVVHGDKARLQQIFLNLISNSIKFTPLGGKIWVELRSEGMEILLTIKDTGIGIDETMIAHIFDPFIQAKNPMSPIESGLGIGLTLVKRLVELHGGTIKVFSEGIGMGSSFNVCLPALADEVRVASPVAFTRKEFAHHQESIILIVDDNIDAAESLAMLLKADGYQTAVGFDGLSALTLASTHLPDVVLLDIGLPGLDGYKVAERLRTMKELGHPLLIAISGYGQSSDVEKARMAGFDEHLVKPADYEVIRGLIEKHVTSLENETILG